ncbi:alternate-type signal peptide domain-containing protein [Microbacterium thalli]|uniref:Alternate-type signal peptide domain-containing protein n=1 Tax=Microbacterium thalli TaxID=3027921 RepID=A0ABT5SKU3_9MICO|nr:alternate-type signal peptide domain-containing protein [Microbacterium thalli]MDD7963460.1 alternate-type signal peptide domain-containing protein [Microbacterium thalli]MDN8548966.1 alternate-type signal peptide domain-containing protein [Microbacterium thalli]
MHVADPDRHHRRRSLVTALHDPSAEAPREPRRWAGGGRPTVALVAAGGIGALLIGAGATTWALWAESAVFAGGPVTAGDLQISRGEGTWRQVTPGVPTPAAGALADGPGDLITMPGDVVEITVPVSTYLRGDNLQAAMTVEAGTSLASDMPSDAIVATYRVQSADASLSSSDVALGHAVTLPGLTGSNEGARADWDVIVTVRVGGPYAWAPESAAGPQHWTLDDFVISLDQVRGVEVAAAGESR